tara:strand:- start:11461 stop:13842 length:2382 start_codon:yes stop_codon:yes gene_type:complete
MNPLKLILDFFSSVRVGIVFMVLLFIYSAVGSSGIPIHWALWEPTTWYAIREAKGLEMTEFEWFHWWPFYALMALFSVTLIVTTIRRIRFNVINLGVWTIHTGIITLVIGSVIYFATKIEGDVPIARARMQIEIPGHETSSVLVMPGATATVGSGADEWSFIVTSIDPEWELLSGSDAGKRAYSVSVSVQSPEQRYVRQLILGYPQYTEDLVASDNPNQPFARAIKVVGTPTVDSDLSLSLVPDVRDRFHVMNSSALYIREIKKQADGSIEPTTPWIERPIHGLPRFNNYLSGLGTTWPIRDDNRTFIEPLSIRVPASDPNDPLNGASVLVTDYLRAAVLEKRTESGGNVLAPSAKVEFTTSEGRKQRYEMFAMDPKSSNADPSLMQFKWIEEESDFDELMEPVGPRIVITIPGDEPRTMTFPIEGLSELEPDLPMQPIEGTDYRWRPVRFDEHLSIEGRDISMLRIELEKDGDLWMRWVFDDPSLNGDLPLPVPGAVPTDHTIERRELDPGIQTRFEPSTRAAAPVLLLAGPGDGTLRLVTNFKSDEPPVAMDVVIDEPMELVPGITMNVPSYSPYTTTSTRPSIVPRGQQDPSIGNQYSMIRVQVPNSSNREAWLAYHHWPFESRDEVLRRFPWRPTTVALSDGRMIQLMLSRKSESLPSKVSLLGFDTKDHIGGFTGSTSSILNWISRVQFDESSGPREADISVNDPAEEGGFWFFQSQWDPPDPARFSGDTPSLGLNYTVLGVGNRRGVWVQLAGSVLMVLGLMYAFYVKPVLVRRRQESAIAKVGAAS